MDSRETARRAAVMINRCLVVSAIGPVTRNFGRHRNAVAFAMSLMLGACGVLGSECTADLTWTVTPTEANLSVGESVTAEAEAFGCGGTEPLEEDMRWRSEDPAVATVNEMTGRITGEAAGSTEIIGEDVGPYRIGPVRIPVTVEPEMSR